MNHFSAQFFITSARLQTLVQQKFLVLATDFVYRSDLYRFAVKNMVRNGLS